MLYCTIVATIVLYSTLVPCHSPMVLENAAPGDADCMAIDANLEVLDNLTQCYRMESGKWNLFANLAQGYVLY